MHPILKNFLMLYHRSQPVKGPYGSARLERTIELKHDSLICRPWYDLVSNGNGWYRSIDSLPPKPNTPSELASVARDPVRIGRVW